MGQMLKTFYSQNSFHANTQLLFGKLLSPKKDQEKQKRIHILF